MCIRDRVKGFDTFVSDMSAIKDKYKELLNKHGIAGDAGTFYHFIGIQYQLFRVLSFRCV